MNGIHIQTASGRKLLILTEVVTSHLVAISVIMRNTRHLDQHVKMKDSFRHCKDIQVPTCTLTNVAPTRKWSVTDHQVLEENILDRQVPKWRDWDRRHHCMVKAQRACLHCWTLEFHDHNKPVQSVELNI